MQHYFVVLLVLIFIFVTSPASAASRLREFQLYDERNLGEDHHALTFQDTAGGTNYSVCATSTLSSTTLQQLCKLVGFTRVDTVTYQSLSSPPAGVPSPGMYITSCVSGVMTNFEDTCTFSTTSDSCNPIALKCSGARYGGEYGTWAYPYYIRMDYKLRFQHRSPFDLNWYYQCDEYVDSTTANALCTMLDGGRVARTGTISSRSISSTSDMAWRNLDCPLGSSTTSFDQCTTTSSLTGCAYYDTLGVICSQQQEALVSGAYKFRLGSQSAYPILEILPKTYSTSNYGRVCDDYFSSTDATFFCNLLGFPSDNANYYSTSSGTSSSSNPFYVTNVGCSSSYTSFDQCSYSVYYSGCYTSESVTLQCPYSIYQEAIAGPTNSGGVYLQALNNSYQVQVRTSLSSAWRGICVSSTSYMSYETSSQIGGYLGLGDSCSWDRNTLVDGQTFLYRNVKCSYSTSSFSSCSRPVSYCSPSSSYALTLPKCWNHSTGLRIGSYDVRISNDGKFRLEVKPIASSTWGTIAYRDVTYGTAVDSSTAYYMCKMLGFYTSTYSFSATSGGSGPVYFANFDCTGYSADDISTDCTWNTPTGDYISGTGNDLSINCNRMATSQQYSSSSSSYDDDGGEMVGIIVGAVWGGIIFIAVSASICASCGCCDSDDECKCDCSDCCSSSDCCSCSDCCSDCSDCCCCCEGSSSTAGAGGGAAGAGATGAFAAAGAAGLGGAALVAQMSREERREARRANRNSWENSSTSSEEDGISDRRCPVCFKVLKSETGRNAHMRTKHPGVDIPAHGMNIGSHNENLNNNAPIAMPFPPPGYTYPTATSPQPPAFPTTTNDNIPPPPGGYNFGPAFGIPMQNMTNMNNNNYDHNQQQPPPGIPNLGGVPPPPAPDYNMAFGMPPPSFGPNSWIPGYGSNRAPQGPNASEQWGGGAHLNDNGYHYNNNNNNNNASSFPLYPGHAHPPPGGSHDAHRGY